jgi:hypothetical protein
MKPSRGSAEGFWRTMGECGWAALLPAGPPTNAQEPQ